MLTPDNLLDAETASDEGNGEYDLVSATPREDLLPVEGRGEQETEAVPYSTMRRDEQSLDTSTDHSTAASIPQTPSAPASTKQKFSRPTLLEAFLGYAFDTRDRFLQTQETTDKILVELQEAQKRAGELVKKGNTEQLEQIEKIKTSIDTSLAAYRLTPGRIWLYQWSLVVFFLLSDVMMAIIVECYCRWHGASFFSLDLYSPANVDILSKIDFVNGPTTMSIAIEVMVWSSLGVWSQQNYTNTVAMLKRKFRFGEHILRFVGTLMRNTSVAAIIVILLRISKFSLFGISLGASNPLAFDITIGLSFLLGFFGNDAYRILSSFRDRLMKGISHSEEED